MPRDSRTPSNTANYKSIKYCNSNSRKCGFLILQAHHFVDYGWRCNISSGCERSKAEQSTGSSKTLLKLFLKKSFEK